MLSKESRGDAGSVQIGGIDLDVDFSEDDMVLDPDPNPPPKGFVGHRERLRRLLAYSRRVQIAIVALVILDCTIVVVELLIDLNILIEDRCGEDRQCPVDAKCNKTDPVPTPTEEKTECLYASGALQCLRKGEGQVNPGFVLHVIGLIVLGIFLVELCLKLYSFGLSFFKHKMEVFDGIIVVVSFAMDAAYGGDEDAWDGVGLLVLLRLWRVVRIVNGVILSVKKKSEKQIHEVQALLKESGDEVDRLKSQLETQRDEIEKLRKFAPSSYGNGSDELVLSTIEKVSVGGGGVSASDEVADDKKEVPDRQETEM